MTDRVNQEDEKKSPNGFEKDDGIPLKKQNQQDSEDGQIFEPVTELDLINIIHGSHS